MSRIPVLSRIPGNHVNTFGHLKLIHRIVASQCIQIMNRSDPTLAEFMQYPTINPAERCKTYYLARDLGYPLIPKHQEALGVSLWFKDVDITSARQSTIDAKGNMQYSEV